MFRLPVILLTIAASSISPQPATGQVQFEAKLLALDANEGIAAADVDRDGRIDLIAGRNWYAAPEWVPRPLRTIEDWNGYVQSNGDFVFDVNEDGWPDVIAGSFIPTEVHWYENPGPPALQSGKLWRQHLLVDTRQSANEGQMLRDLDRDDSPEWIVNSWVKDVPTVVWRMQKKSPQSLEQVDQVNDQRGAKFELVPHKLGDRGNGHGLGVGDLNGDGRDDVLVGQGWYEQPPSNTWERPWKFHADWDLQASLPMIVTDVDGDERNDLIVGNGHDYGLFWWHNNGLTENGSLIWTEHEIDRQYSQPHTLAWADIDGDGDGELIAGKRYFAHNGNDPGGKEPPCLYYYDWDAVAKTFIRHTIDEGHVGCGLQIVTADLTGDGKTDIAVAGKSGTYLLIAQ